MEDNHAKQEWLGPVDLEQFMLKLFPEYFSYTYMSQELVNTVDFFGVNCIFWQLRFTIHDGESKKLML